MSPDGGGDALAESTSRCTSSAIRVNSPPTRVHRWERALGVGSPEPRTVSGGSAEALCQDWGVDTEGVGSQSESLDGRENLEQHEPLRIGRRNENLQVPDGYPTERIRSPRPISFQVPEGHWRPASVPGVDRGAPDLPAVDGRGPSLASAASVLCQRGLAKAVAFPKRWAFG